MSSSYTLDVTNVIPIMMELAETRSPISQAAGAAIRLNVAAHNVKTDGPTFAGLEQDAIYLLFIFVEELREKGQRNLDDKTRGDLDALTGVLVKITELAQSNAAMSDEKASSHSDEEGLGSLREELQQLLPAFDVLSFTDLRTKISERIRSLDNGTMHVENQGGGKSVVVFGETNLEGDDGSNFGVLNATSGDPGSHHISGEYTSGDFNRVRYRGQNVALNYGRVYGQNIGNNATFYFENLPPPAPE
ncbi:hypothetical protein JOM56_009999 [Amanita muscaria]